MTVLVKQLCYYHIAHAWTHRNTVAELTVTYGLLRSSLQGPYTTLRDKNVSMSCVPTTVQHFYIHDKYHNQCYGWLHT
eukprot:5819078-Amphidinium_carterae.1